MNARRILLLSLLALSYPDARAQTPTWSQFPNSPSGTTRHDDIYMFNETTGWTARGRAGIWKTTDGGQTWIQKLNKTDAHFRCIGFASAMRGWAGNLGPGSYDSGVTETNVMYETFDGGETWTNHPGFREAGMLGLCSFHVFDPQTIYGVGRVRGPAYFIKSTDGGTNWSMTNLTAAGVMGGMMDVYFRDKTNGFVVGMNTNTFATGCASNYYGRIARTTDGGATWTPVATTTISCCYFWKMSWPTANIGYVSLQQNVDFDPSRNNTLIFFKTTDGGATWISNGVPYNAIAPGIITNNSSGNGFYWQGIGFISANEGWAGGSQLTTPYANSFLHTTDGGLTWTPVGYNNSASINRIRILSPTLAYASGQKLHVFRIPLVITNQPQSQWVSVGGSVTLSVGVTGNPPFSYQWRKENINIPGATNSTLGLTNLMRSQSGDYSVIVTNLTTVTQSSNAVLRVFAPEILRTPQIISNQTVRVLFGDADGTPLTTNELSNFQVLASTNLTTWQPLTNLLSLTNGLLILEDFLLYPSRFYRVIEH